MGEQQGIRRAFVKDYECRDIVGQEVMQHMGHMHSVALASIVAEHCFASLRIASSSQQYYRQSL